MNGGFAYGVWGGLSPKERRALIRLRYRVACPVCRGQLIITAEGAEWQACASCAVTWRCRKREMILDEHVDNHDSSGTGGTNARGA